MVEAAAAALLDAASARIGAADAEWVVCDHAAAEAVVFAAGCLDVAVTHPSVALQCLEHAKRLLDALPVPTERYVFQDRVRLELAELGLPFEVGTQLGLVA